MVKWGLVAFAAALGLPTGAAAVTIDFEGLGNGALVSNQFSGVAFSLSNGSSPSIYQDADYARSGSNGLINRGTDKNVGHLKVKFTDPISNLKFFFSAEDTSFYVRVYHEGTSSVVWFDYDGKATDIDKADLTGFTGVTSFVIVEQTLNTGDGNKQDSIIIDDLKFSVEPPGVPAPVPLPPAAALLVSGLGGLGFFRWLGRKTPRIR